MKNILKKLGILVLAIAVLSPFLKLPVKADSSDCEKSVVNYLFMDQKAAGLPWDPYVGDGYRTFTSFLYDYPSSLELAGKTLTINSVSFNDVNTEDELKAFYEIFLDLSSDKEVDESVKNAFGNFKNLTSGSSINFSNQDVEQTFIMHGKWARVDENAQHEDYEQDVENLKKLGSASEFAKLTLQGAFRNSGKTKYIEDDYFKVSFGGASLSQTSRGETYALAGGAYATNAGILDYFDKIIKDVNSGNSYADSFEKDYVWGTDSTGEKYINLSISRTATDNFFDAITFGRKYNDKLYAFSTSSSSITNSYDAYEEWFDVAVPNYDTTNPWDGTNDMDKTGCAIVTGGTAAAPIPNANNNNATTKNCYWIEADEDEITINTSAGNYYHPYVLAVEYSVCSTSTPEPEKLKWTLQYDANTEDTTVTGTPSSQSANVGTEIIISEGPKSDNYKFVKWCKNSDGTGDCYDAGETIKSASATTVTLYAQWAEKGTTDNNDTGIATYLLSFVAVGTIAGGIYLVAKKKNLFKQI